MYEKRSLIKTISDRKKNWIVRGDGLMKLVLEWRMERKRPRGRPRMGMIDGVLDIDRWCIIWGYEEEG